MQSELQIRGSLKQSVDRLVIHSRIERMARRLAWVGAITFISWLILSIASIAAVRRLFIFSLIHKRKNAAARIRAKRRSPKLTTNLRTAKSQQIMFHRLGSLGSIDVYETVSLNGAEWDILFLDL